MFAGQAACVPGGKQDVRGHPDDGDILPADMNVSPGLPFDPGVADALLRAGAMNIMKGNGQMEWSVRYKNGGSVLCVRSIYQFGLLAVSICPLLFKN